MQITTTTIDTTPEQDTTPEPRYCWHCERETRQVRAESGGAVWWMCTECYECERQEWQELQSASQSLKAAVQENIDALVDKLAKMLKKE